MTTSNGAVGDIVEGTVQARNATGIRVNGVWAQQSKFSQPPIDLPDKGTRVRCVLDTKGFIRTLEVLGGSTPRSTVGRDATITRLSVLKSAAVFLGQLSQTREEVRSEHVLTLADKWLAWVEQQSEEPEF